MDVTSKTTATDVALAEELVQAQNALERLYNCREKVEFFLENAADGGETAADSALTEAVGRIKDEFRAAMDDDINTAGALAALFDLSRTINSALDAAQQATNSNLLEASIAGASRVLFSIAGGPDLTLTEVDEAARTVEACADENANIIYGQIIDESMGDQVRITVIATGFKMNAPQQSSLDFSRKDLFASTDPTPAPSSAPVTFSTTPSAGRFADEDYIPDFLRRQR